MATQRARHGPSYSLSSAHLFDYNSDGVSENEYQARPRPRIRTTVHPPSPPLRASNHQVEDTSPRTRFQDQRMGNPRSQLRPVRVSHGTIPTEGHEDDRLIVCWVDEHDVEYLDTPSLAPARPPMPERPVSFLSDGETLLGTGTYPGPSPHDQISLAGSYGFPAERSPQQRYTDFHSDSEISASQPPQSSAIPTPPPESEHHLPTIPGVHPALPVLDGHHSELALSEASLPSPHPKAPTFAEACQVLQKNDTAKYLEMLSHKEFDPSIGERVLRKLTNIVRDSFGERQGPNTIHRVYVVPRNRLSLEKYPKVDVDLVIPSDFVLRWESSRRPPTPIARALGLDPAAVARAEIDEGDLQRVLQAIWERLEGNSDQPTGRSWCSRYKPNLLSNRLRLCTLDRIPVQINIFVKVAVRVFGQDVLVGVDQQSARSGGKYQITKVSPDSVVPSALPHLERNAILSLIWWQESIKDLQAAGAQPRLRTSHFALALTALHQLDPTHELYLPSTGGTKFTLLGMLEIMVMVSRYLEQAYDSPVDSSSESPKYPFALASCTIFDALYTQAMANPDELAATRLVLREMSLGLQDTIQELKRRDAELPKEPKDLGRSKESEFLRKVSDMLGRVQPTTPPGSSSLTRNSRLLSELGPGRTPEPQSQSQADSPAHPLPASRPPASKFRALTLGARNTFPMSPVAESPTSLSPVNPRGPNYAGARSQSLSLGSTPSVLPWSVPIRTEQPPAPLGSTSSTLGVPAASNTAPTATPQIIRSVSQSNSETPKPVPVVAPEEPKPGKGKAVVAAEENVPKENKSGEHSKEPLPQATESPKPMIQPLEDTAESQKAPQPATESEGDAEKAMTPEPKAPESTATTGAQKSNDLPRGASPVCLAPFDG